MIYQDPQRKKKKKKKDYSPKASNKNSRALPLSHLIVGRISNTILP